LQLLNQIQGAPRKIRIRAAGSVHSNRCGARGESWEGAQKGLDELAASVAAYPGAPASVSDLKAAIIAIHEAFIDDTATNDEICDAVFKHPAVQRMFAK
jgi:hypothetical protein